MNLRPRCAVQGHRRKPCPPRSAMKHRYYESGASAPTMRYHNMNMMTRDNMGAQRPKFSNGQCFRLQLWPGHGFCGSHAPSLPCHIGFSARFGCGNMKLHTNPNVETRVFPACMSVRSCNIPPRDATNAKAHASTYNFRKTRRMHEARHHNRGAQLGALQANRRPTSLLGDPLPRPLGVRRRSNRR